MPRGKKLSYQDYLKLLNFFKENFDTVLTRETILKYIGVSKFEIIINLIKQFASYEDYQYFKIFDKRSKKFYIINYDNFNLEEFKGEEHMADEGFDIMEEALIMEDEFYGYEEVMEHDSELEYARAVEKILPLGKVNFNDLPIKKCEHFYFFQNVFFDMTVLNYSKEVFFRNLALIPNPKLLIHSNLVNDLDKVNAKDSLYNDYQKCYAKSLLKFIGEDNKGKFSRVDSNNLSTTRDLVKYAKRNNAIVLSSDPILITYCMLYNVKFKILEAPIENPFDSNSDINCGIDASIISQSVEELKERFKKFNSILICEVTLFELERILYGDFTVQDKESAKFILQSVAYYGNAKFSSKRLGNADQSIVNFYRENPVGLVLTADSGFSANSRTYGVPYALYLNKNSSSSEFTNFFEAQFNFEDYIDNQNFNFKTMVLSINQTFFEINMLTLLLKRVVVQVFSPPQTLKETINGSIRIYQNDIVVFRTMDLITIVVCSNIKACRGKVWYTGLIENLPEKYKKFLV